MVKSPDNDHLLFLGIRHHGPGCARSVVEALEAFGPDIVLIEGPPEGDALLSLAKEPDLKPPVSLLVYQPTETSNASYYPFVEFSPEWQAIQFTVDREIPAKFIDLSLGVRSQLEKKEDVERTEDDSQVSEEPIEEGEAVFDQELDEETLLLRLDPLGLVARCAGFADGERWWEQQVEQRSDSSEMFEAITELMTALREEAEAKGQIAESDLLREACMREHIRGAVREYGKIAVVCGAWHVPALVNLGKATADKKLLKGHKKVKMQATWVPWTFNRMTYSSGYGAGIESPGYYQHLWEHGNKQDSSDFTIRWMTRLASLLREEGLDASTASVIEAVRLAETTASLRGRALPGLGEMNESCQAVLCFGDHAPLKLIHQKLIIGERMGRIPKAAPSVALQEDLERLQKKLRIKPEASDRVLDLDLRKENDLQRSYLFHRLTLLNIPWAKSERATKRSKGTFHEFWRLRWEPEFSIKMIEASVFGNTVETAAGLYAVNSAQKVTKLSELAELTEQVILANLLGAIQKITHLLGEMANVGGDIQHMMRALPPLANVMRYGNVRQTDASMIQSVVEGMFIRICLGLPNACGSLNDEAAEEMILSLSSTNSVVGMLNEESFDGSWNTAVESLVSSRYHGLISGKATRILFDRNHWSIEQVEPQLNMALSIGTDPEDAASWLEGFLKGGGAMLVHHPDLWKLIDRWVCSLSGDDFTRVSPLLRRTFSTLEKGVKVQLGSKAGQVSEGDLSGTRAGSVEVESGEINRERANTVVPILQELLGVK